jgi:hypothetical protein
MIAVIMNVLYRTPSEADPLAIKTGITMIKRTREKIIRLTIKVITRKDQKLDPAPPKKSEAPNLFSDFLRLLNNPPL